jgi:hypothetical protein
MIIGRRAIDPRLDFPIRAIGTGDDSMLDSTGGQQAAEP